jgi:hypothetical protein
MWIVIVVAAVVVLAVFGAALWVSREKGKDLRFTAGVLWLFRFGVELTSPGNDKHKDAEPPAD